MKNKFATLFIYILAAVPAFSQDTDAVFKVLASKGDNKYQATGSLEEKPLVIGKKLMKGDKIVVDENGYAGLAFHSGKTIEIKKAGTYEINKLVPEVNTQNAGLGKKYIDFVVGEMTASAEDMSKNRHKYMAVTGSVERGNYGINLIVPHNKIQSFVIAKPTTIRWNTAPGVSKYTVKIDNMFDEHLFNTETADTSIVLDLVNLNPKNENTQYILRVSSKGKTQEVQAQDFSLKYIGGDKGAGLIRKLNELTTEFGEENALNKILVASFFEENKLFLNAMENYEAAIRMQPDVEDFKSVYHQFLQRTGMIQDNVK